MKKFFANLFLVLSCIFLGIDVPTNLYYYVTQKQESYLIFAISSALTVFICLFAIVKIKNAKTKKELLPTAIITLLFGNLVAGILMLCLKDQDLNPVTFSYTDPYGSPYRAPNADPYGSPYGSTPYNGPYGGPYGGASANQEEKDKKEEEQEPSSPYINPTETPFYRVMNETEEQDSNTPENEPSAPSDNEE